MEKEYEMREANPQLNSVTAGIAYSAAAIAIVAVSLIISIIITAFNVEKGTDAYVYLSYIGAPTALFITVAAVCAARKVRPKEILPVKCSLKYYLIAVLLIFGLLFALGWVNDLTVEFFKLFGYVPRPDESYLPDMTGWKVIPAFIVIAVLPAIFEEAFFRGLLLGSMENGVGSIRAIFIVGFCFSLFHTSPEQTVYQFISGCAFAFLAIRSRSLLPSVLMHFINNGLIVVLYACGCFDENGALIISEGGNIALMCVSAACLIGATVWLVLDKTPLKKAQTKGIADFFLFASVGIAVLVIIWLTNLFGVG